MKNDAAWYILSLILSVGISLLLYGQLKGSLEKLLAQCIRVAEGPTFFLRSFGLGLLLVTLGQAFSKEFQHKPEAHIMEYVWSVAGLLSDVFQGLYWAIGLALILVTVLVATLKPNHDK